MQMAAARLHGEILFRPDGISDGRAFERRADVEAPQFLERFVVVSDDPAILQCAEDQPAGGSERTGTVLDIEDLLGDHFVVDRIVGGYRAVVEIARKGALGELLAIETAVGSLESRSRTVL